MKKYLCTVFTVLLLLLGVASVEAQKFQVLKDGQEVYQFTCPTMPVPPDTQGEWADEVARSLKANVPYGTGGKITFPVKRGSTTYILIDPKAFGVPWTKSGIYVRIEDSLTINGGSFQFRILELDKLSNLKYPWPVGPGSAGMYSRSLTGYTQEEYNAGDRFLLEVKEVGVKDTTLTVKWG